MAAWHLDRQVFMTCSEPEYLRVVSRRTTFKRRRVVIGTYINTPLVSRVICVRFNSAHSACVFTQNNFLE